MALYLDHCTRAGFGSEQEHAVVRKRYSLVDGKFGGLWTLEEAISESKSDVFKDKNDRLFSLRILTFPDQP